MRRRACGGVDTVMLFEPRNGVAGYVLPKVRGRVGWDGRGVWTAGELEWNEWVAFQKLPPLKLRSATVSLGGQLGAFSFRAWAILA